MAKGGGFTNLHQLWRPKGGGVPNPPPAFAHGIRAVQADTGAGEEAAIPPRWLIPGANDRVAAEAEHNAWPSDLPCEIERDRAR